MIDPSDAQLGITRRMCAGSNPKANCYIDMCALCSRRLDFRDRDALIVPDSTAVHLPCDQAASFHRLATDFTRFDCGVAISCIRPSRSSK